MLCAKNQVYTRREDERRRSQTSKCGVGINQITIQIEYRGAQ